MHLVLSSRSSCRSCSITKDVFRNFAKFTAQHLCQSLIFNKVAGLSPATLLKKRLWYRCFPANFAKFRRTAFLQNTFSGCFWSSPKWIDSLLSTSQSYTFTKSLFKRFPIFARSLCWSRKFKRDKRYLRRLHTDIYDSLTDLPNINKSCNIVFIFVLVVAIGFKKFFIGY